MSPFVAVIKIFDQGNRVGLVDDRTDLTKRKLKCGEASKPMTFEKWLESKRRMEKIRGRK